MVNEIESMNTDGMETIANERLLGKITKIEQGKLKDFFPIDKLKKAESGERDALQLTAEAGAESCRVVMSITKFRNSNFQKYLRRYKKIAVGTEIDLFRNESGFLRFDLAV